MHILLTAHQFFPEHRSGTEVLTLSVAQELRRRGHRVTVFAGAPAADASQAGRCDDYVYDGVPVCRVTHAHGPLGGQRIVAEIEYDNRFAAGVFAQVVQRTAPDVLHAFHLGRLGAGLLDVAAARCLPAFYTPTDFWAVCPTSQLLLPDGRTCAGPLRHAGNCARHLAQTTRAGPLAALLPDAAADMLAGLTARGLMPPYPHRADVAAVARRREFVMARLNVLAAVLSPTAAMTRALVAHGLDPARIVPMPYGIDLPAVTPAPIARDPARPLRVGFIGTLARHKGCHVLIDAARRLPPERIEVSVYGNPADFPDYAAALRARTAGAAHIAFRGTFPPAEIGAMLAGLDVLVVPSLWVENTPLVVFAALAARRPVIASDFPGLAEVVSDGVNGLTFPPGDAAALAERLGRLADDAALLGSLSAACRPPKSTAAYVDELTALYERALRSR